jgi:predicted N-acetyltransferase YhbS
MLQIEIRDELPEDYEQITQITIAAFTNHPYSNCREYILVEKLREKKSLTVSLVAIVNGEVAGHVAFSPVQVAGIACNWYSVGPLSVKPELQKQGIGSALMRAGMEKIKGIGGQGCVLVGDPLYYVRFGYHNSDIMTFPHAPKENFMIIEFGGGEIPGEVDFDAAFAECA